MILGVRCILSIEKKNYPIALHTKRHNDKYQRTPLSAKSMCSFLCLLNTLFMHHKSKQFKMIDTRCKYVLQLIDTFGWVFAAWIRSFLSTPIRYNRIHCFYGTFPWEMKCHSGYIILYACHLIVGKHKKKLWIFKTLFAFRRNFSSKFRNFMFQSSFEQFNRRQLTH